MYLEGIFDFIEQTLKLETDYDPKIISSCISLIGDIASQFSYQQGLRAKVTANYIEKGIIYL